MHLYKDYWIYFAPYLAVTGRLSYLGYAAHPHSGKLFRFATIKGEKLSKQEFMHLKVALSCTFGNTFPTPEEHDK